ncbi:MAG: hypothetical protein LBR11_05905, partial [Deltaproteobacteria bacterium]|nr:hypothetical protein [Deltaproteobacteria bacterium]
EDALSSLGQKFISQLAINVIYDGVPIRAHLDLVLLDQVSHEVTVLELKSVGTIKESVAQTHEAQINGQISLLSKFWRDPVFQVNYNDKLVAFPEIVKQLLNVSLDDNPDKHSISGYVLTVSPNKAKAFGPYTPDINFLKELSGQAYFIWKTISDIRDGVKTLADVPIMDSFSPLCDYCRFNKECPKFKGESQLGLEQELAALAELKAQRNRLEEDINEREGQLKTLYTLMGKTGQWIDSGAYRFKVSTQKGRVTLDQFALKKNLIERLQLDEKLMTDIISFSSKTGKAFERFYLSPIN